MLGARDRQKNLGSRPASGTALRARGLRACLLAFALALAGLQGCADGGGETSLVRSASVERLPGGALRVEWTASPEAGEVTVYVGTDPTAIPRDTPVGRGGAQGSIAVEGLDPARRYYFEVVAGDAGVVTAERRVPLAGAVNFRDLGGYETMSGRRTRWGQVFRSDELNRLVEADLGVFSNLGLKLLCDFRSPTEVGRAPDRLPEEGAPEVLHLPIYDPDNDIEAMITDAITSGDFARQDELFGGGRNEQLLVDAGRRLVNDSTEEYSACIRRLADPASLPALTHCTAGKDRTGFSSAVVLLALDMPEETVMQDYLLSNVYRAERNEQTIVTVRPLMRDSELLRPLLEVRREYLQASFDEIRERYGDVEAYLREALGIEGETLASLRENLLD